MNIIKGREPPLVAEYSKYFDEDISIEEMSYLLECSQKEERPHCLVTDSGWFMFDDELGVLNKGKEPIIVQSVFSCMKYIKRLNFIAVTMGYGLPRFYSWHENLSYLLDEYVDFGSMISLCLGYDKCSLMDACIMLGNNLTMRDTLGFIDLLRCSKLNCTVGGTGYLRVSGYVYKDYSDCTGHISGRGWRYALVVDCEGKPSGVLTDGCRQLGGVLYAVRDSLMIPLHKFIVNDGIIEDTLSGVHKMYTQAGGFGVCDVYVFGKSDIVMLESSISNRLFKRFNFIDCTFEVKGKLSDDFVGKATLSNIARYLGVFVARPRHNALADARTLFNILSRIRRM